MKPVILLLLLAVPFGAVLAAISAPKPEVELYEVDGASLAELREGLATRGPVGQDAVRYHGYTEWHVSWSYRTATDGASCEIVDFSTTVTATIMLPIWRPAPRVDAGLVERWTTYRNALERHELGHHAFALAAADELERELGALSGDAGYAPLVEQLNARGSEIVAQQAELEREYDRTTDHGATQGAIL